MSLPIPIPIELSRLVCALAILASLALNGIEAEEEAVAEPGGKQEAGEDEEMSSEDPLAEILGSDAKWIFVPPAQRRDVFRDPEEIRRAEISIKNLKNSQIDKVHPIDPIVPIDDIEAALGQIARLIPGITSAMQQGDWATAIQTCDEGLSLLSKLQARNPKHERLKMVLDQLVDYRTRAQDEQIKEEAESAFAGLGLRIQGILWSASDPALAIVEYPKSGSSDVVTKTCQVKTELLDCTITHIDVNRVDFYFRYKQRDFNFNLYLEDDL